MMRRFLRRQIRAYDELEPGDRAWWVLQWLFVFALVVIAIAFFTYLIVSGDISSEVREGG